MLDPKRIEPLKLNKANRERFILASAQNTISSQEENPLALEQVRIRKINRDHFFPEVVDGDIE